jgi:putative ABC transport system substrate-binding protein
MTGIGGDPVEAGLIESLARPGGNVTGLALLSRELSGKRLELLKKAVPKLAVSQFSTIRPVRTVYSR